MSRNCGIYTDKIFILCKTLKFHNYNKIIPTIKMQYQNQEKIDSKTTILHLKVNDYLEIWKYCF